MSEVGPGNTRYIATEEGGINCRMWNDPSWETTMAQPGDIRNAHQIAQLLAKAYQAGLADRGILIRRAIGTPGRLG